VKVEVEGEMKEEEKIRKFNELVLATFIIFAVVVIISFLLGWYFGYLE